MSDWRLNGQEVLMKSEIFYLDDRDRIVPKEQATRAIIRECDDTGRLVSETFVLLEDTQPSPELSEEDLGLIAEFDEKYGHNLRKL